jgi:ankyrin repeat protein
VNNSNSNRDTSLNIAASKGFKEILCLLLANKKIEAEKPNNSNKTPLISALENGQYECAKFLIEAKANVNRADNTGATPVHLAIGMFSLFSCNFIEKNQQDLLELIIKRGANLEGIKVNNTKMLLIFLERNT